jgi:hypothetical protein
MTKQKRIEAVIEVAIEYGNTDGGHHKQYALDQILRILTGCPTKTEHATDSQGTPYTYEALGESDEYLALVDEDWDVGMP